MNIKEFEEHYVSYYHFLERDFLKTIDYVTLHESNYNAFSSKYTSLLLSIGSEIDVLSKLLAKNLSKKTGRNIKLIYENILINYPIDYISLKEMEVNIKDKAKLIIKPWSDLDISKNETFTFWWSNYNKIKHHRIEEENYIKANLESNLYGLAALYCLVLVVYRNIAEKDGIKDFLMPQRTSEIFELMNWIPYTLRLNGSLVLD